MQSGSMDIYLAKLTKAINYCNTQILNPSEYCVIKAVFNHFRDKEDGYEKLTVENLANESAFSQASISRFIKKIGYDSFQEFRMSFHNARQRLLERRGSHVEHLYGRDAKTAVDTRYQQAVDNLTKTYQSFDLPGYERIVRQMLSASSVTFISDDLGLSLFFTLQLDLIACGIPVFLFKNIEVQKEHSQSLGKDDLVIFLNADAGFTTDEQWEILRHLHGKARMIGFFQDRRPDLQKLFDQCVFYGAEGRVHDGFYSLFLISRIFSDLIHMAQS